MLYVHARMPDLLIAIEAKSGNTRHIVLWGSDALPALIVLSMGETICPGILLASPSTASSPLWGQLQYLAVDPLLLFADTFSESASTVPNISISGTCTGA